MDELVPPAHMEKLHELAIKSAFKDFYKVPGGRHNNTFDVGGVNYYQAYRSFF